MVHYDSHLLIPVAPPGSISMQRIASGIREPGKIIHSNGRISLWEWYGMMEHEGVICIKGSPLTVKPALDYILSEKRTEKEALIASKLLYHGFQTASGEENGFTPSFIHGFFFSFDKGAALEALLVLPRFLRDLIASNSKQADSVIPFVELPGIKNYHPDWRDFSSTFGAAASLYRMLLGKNPFPETSFSSSWERARLSGPFPPDLKHSAANVLLDKALCLPSALERRGPYPIVVVNGALKELNSVLTSIDESSTMDIFSSNSQLSATPEELEKKRSFPVRQRVFFRKHKRKLIMTAAGLILLFAAGSFTSNLLFRTLPTDGMEPEEVVSLFYEARNSLDHESLSAALKGSTGSAIVTEITNLYVISRVRMGYERQDVLIPAPQWFEQGSPDIPEDKMVYGVAGLSLQERGSRTDPERRVFRTEYLRIFPSEHDGTDSHAGFEIMKVTEDLTLTYSGKRWEITDIQPVLNVSLEKEDAVEYLNLQSD
jgi:hypothetical protein